jgi:hypothetical protein
MSRHLIVVLRLKYRLSGLAVRVPSYRSRGGGFDSRRYQIFGDLMGSETGSTHM